MAQKSPLRFARKLYLIVGHAVGWAGAHVGEECLIASFSPGGMREIALHTNRQYLRGLVGCISHLTLSTDYHISLVEDAADGKNINMCGTKWQERRPGAEDPSCSCVCSWKRAGCRSPPQPDHSHHQKMTEPKGNPKKKNIFPLLSSADQTKLSILCRSRPLYPLRV